MLSRLYEERAIRLQRQGRFGLLSPALGQEAAIIGSAMALDVNRDWVVPQYREAMAMVHHGVPLEIMCAQYLGKVDGARFPAGVNVLPTQVSIAAQLPHACGLAWGLRMRHADAVVLVYFGDGGSSEGDFHESLNLAGVKRLPVVFLLQNNQWAISTPRRLQSAAESLAIRAEGYGFPGVQVDGNDVASVYECTVAAVRRAREDRGPTLIEAVTYRLGFHNTTDDPSRYRTRSDEEAAKKRDPIDRVTRYLTSIGQWNEGQQREMVSGLRAEIDAALFSARSLPDPTPEQLFDNSYTLLPPRVQRQRESALLDSMDS
ncbi:MAG TPA: thiamine pyrophosphate-dependent enzyme [Acidimicrobiales bacterium]|nr:thiamine pyrophosphate-dependent enzyme [Acidimicrobiales bacterium]